MRVVVRILSCLLGLALAVAGGLAVLEIAWAWARPGDPALLIDWPRWRDELGSLPWNSTAMRVTAGVLAGVGLLLLLMAATARRKEVRLNDPAEGVSVTTSPRSLARIVGFQVRSADNVRAASVTASARKIRVRATTRLETEAQLQPRLMELVQETVDALPLVRRPKISVVVDSPRDRR
ncbi:hypothetical protein EV193_102616 [Herbihabitans rhizosphaerae]|uniref:DUF6286 domain-containing protein n=1 Tax=Herbihabitans rhizosphaerae TaxID=1872711 RepID=A0A4Q7L323_9PSEU|nr:DUF6286 domain-containing protein [Herbihabitans rhizosphaerae]RZS43635.1 hypothetical protein EV193_102616 [Herbihabitans rhizosphaerae]